MTPSDSRHRSDASQDPGDDVDPTGVRELLRSLPDPGPMPEDVVRRIETRLAVELAHRDGPSFPDPGGDEHPAGTIDLAAARARRRPGRSLGVLAAAAAGVLVATVGFGELADSGVLGGTGTAAYAPSGASADAGSDAAGDDAGSRADDRGAEGGAEGGAQGGSDGAADTAAAPLGQGGGAAVGSVEVLPHLGEVHAADLAQLELPTTGAQEAAEADLTAAQAESCWSAHRAADTWATHYAAPATSDGRRTVVLVGLHEDGSGRAWLMPGRCVEDPSVPALADATLRP